MSSLGTSFFLRSVNFGWFIRDYLTWPLIPDEGQESELVHPALRYTAAGGTVLLSVLCGWYFFYAPSRMVTRVTIYPRTQMVGLRTATAAPVRFLPASLRARPFFRRAGTLSPTDPRERLVPLAELYRLQGSAVGSEVALCTQLVKDGATLPPHIATWLQKAAPSIPKLDQQDTLMLRVGDARLAFQLSAQPQRASFLGEKPPGGIRRFFHLLLRGATDWEQAPGYEPGAAEKAAQAQRAANGVDTEPWFLDRANFDQLFPLDATRYKKK